jgi:hypothetical protein
MHIAIWIFIFIGLGLWSLLSWGLHAVLTLDPQWLEDVQALIERVPYAEEIDRWMPGWRELLAMATDLAQSVLGWVGSNAPLVAWIVWGIGALLLLGAGGVLSLIVCMLSENEHKPGRPGAATA